MRLALLNLRFSPNLGDVLLCECLEYGLRRAAANVDVIQLDITGRRSFAKGSAKRLAAMAVLQRLPRALRAQFARVILGRSLRRVMPYWRGTLATVDAAVLGGGHLLADADLNFPLKVAAIFRVVAEARVPAGVFGVGVSDNWSRYGERLFRDALGSVRLRYAAVRDQRSRDTWIRRLGSAGIPAPRIVRDPGLLTAECYPAPARAAHSPTRVGICLSHPVALRYHADDEMPTAAVMTSWFTDLAHALTRKGFLAFLFTTGSPEDEAYLDAVAPMMTKGCDPAGTIERLPRPSSAADMARSISTFDLLLGHRLHACIAAYSYGVPNIGFTWDDKMRSFFESIDRSQYIREAGATSVADIIKLADEALSAGIDITKRDAVVAEAQADITKLLHEMSLA